jgi:hypothetical protein
MVRQTHCFYGSGKRKAPHSRSMWHSKATHLMARVQKKRKRKRLGPHNLLQGHAVNDLKPSHEAPPLKGSTTFQQCHPGPLGTFNVTPSIWGSGTSGGCGID